MNEGNYADALRAFQRKYFGDLLRWCKGDVTQVAAMSGVERTHLYKTFKRLGLDAKHYRASQPRTE